MERTGGPMRVHLLGQIEAIADLDAAPVALGGPTQRRILAALALHRNEVVSVSRLVDVIWSHGAVPDRAEHNVRTYVHRLRSALDGQGDRVETVGVGYRMRLDTEELDAARFEELAGTAARLAETGDAVAALDTIDEAERLWRGTPVEEFEDEEWAVPDVVHFSEIHTALRVTRAVVLLDAGRADEAVAAADELVRDEPLWERPRALRMRALYEAGRHAEALRAFQDFRRELIDEVGLEPSSDLVQLDRQIAMAELQPAGEMRRAVGGFELHDRIGEGAFAVVHRATQASLGREVAVKIIRAELANRPDFIRRFEAEAQMVARIEHPNVVPLYDYWREPDRAFLVMRWMAGGSLETRLDEGPWPLEEAVELVDRIASALASAHDHGVIHRNVKPANVLFDDAGRAYLSDFGIALEADEASRPEVALPDGSREHASPEQLRHEPAGPEADVYALAIIAYALLTGRTPFAETLDEPTRLHRQLHEPIPSTRAVRADLPSQVDDVLVMATAKNPADRYPTATNFALALRAAIAAPTDTQLVTPRGPRTNPYKGLRAFDETDAADFHGRERLVNELIGHLAHPDTRMLAVVGPSGSGKSSVVRAGVIPALRLDRVSGSSKWFTTTMIPGARPYEALEIALLRVAVNPPATLLDQLRDGERGIIRAVKRILPDDDGVIAIVIDQFEELFAHDVAAVERDLFLRAIAAAATEPASPVRILLTLRADFYDRPLRHAEFAPLLKQHSVVVTPLAPDELENAIVAPAAAVGVGFEGGLVAEIVDDINHEPGALPLLQYALTQAFDATDDDTITIDGYRSIGGITGALGRRAEELWQAAPDDEQLAASRLFGRLVALGEGTEDTRRRIQRAEVSGDAATAAAIDRFGSARLLTFDQDPGTREPTIEIAHEALIREWPRLRGWLDDDRDALRIHRHLTIAATGWSERDCDPNELYRGARLDTAESLLSETSLSLNQNEAEFLTTSLRQRDREAAAERRRVRRLRRLVTATALVAVAALGATVLAVRAQGRASDNASAADVQRLRAQATAVAETNPQVAALLAVEAYRHAPTPESLAILNFVLTALPGYRANLAGDYGDRVELVDGGNSVVAATRSSLDVWNLETRQLTRRLEFAPQGASPPFDVSIDGRHAVVATEDGTVTVFDLGTGSTVGTAGDGGAAAKAVAMSSTGRLVAIARSTSLEIVEWNTGIELASIASEEDSFLPSECPFRPRLVEWSPTSDMLAIATDAGIISVWNAADEDMQKWTPPVHQENCRAFAESSAHSLLFTNSGKQLVVSTRESRFSDDTRVRTFETSSLVETRDSTSTHGVALSEMFWLDEGNSVVAGSTDAGDIVAFDLAAGSETDSPLDRVTGALDVSLVETVGSAVVLTRSGIEVWTLDGSTPLERRFPLTPEQIESLDEGGSAIRTALALDGSRLDISATAIADPTTTVSFDVRSSRAVPPPTDEMGSFTGYGDWRLHAGYNGLRLMSPDGEWVGDRISVNASHRTENGVFGPLTSFEASADGRFVATAAPDAVSLYSGTGRYLTQLDGLGEIEDSDGIYVSFDRGGTMIAAYGLGGTWPWALWSTETLEILASGTGSDAIHPVLVGNSLYTSETDSKFAIVTRDPSSLDPIGQPLLGHAAAAERYATDHSERIVAAATTDGTVRVWDVESGVQLGRPLAVSDGANIQFTADGSLLSVPDEDQVTLWNFDVDTWVDVACVLAGRNMTSDEWAEVGPTTTEYRATCAQYPVGA